MNRLLVISLMIMLLTGGVRADSGKPMQPLAEPAQSIKATPVASIQSLGRNPAVFNCMAEQDNFWTRLNFIDTEARIDILRAQSAAIERGNFRTAEQETALIPLKAASLKMDMLLERFATETDPQMLLMMQEVYLSLLETIMRAVPTYKDLAPAISRDAGLNAQYYLQQYDAAGIHEKTCACIEALKTSAVDS